MTQPVKARPDIENDSAENDAEPSGITEYRQRLASIVEFSDDAIISMTLDGIITSWNRGALRLFGYTAIEAIGQSVTMLIPVDRPDEKAGILARIQRGEHVQHYETVRRRKDGTLVDISLTVSPLKNAEGRIVGASKIARDITDRKRASEQQALLVREFQHRIKNTIATVQAIAGQTLYSLTVAERDAFVARLHALSSAHDLMAETNWNRTSMREIVDRALDGFRDRDRERFDGDGPDAYLDANRSFMLTMVLHELATNAVKYGALSNATGMVDLGWEMLQGDRSGLRFWWRERNGPPVKPPERRGFGSLLIRRALEGGQGKATLEFEPGGITCVLEILL